MAKTAETKENYLNRGHQLWKMASIYNEIRKEQLLPSLFLDWLERTLPNLKSSSRRQYIAAAREFLPTIKPINNRGWHSNLSNSLNRINIMQASNYPSSRLNNILPLARTSAMKAKKTNPTDFEKLLECAKSKRKWDYPAIIWFEATVLVGLRPCEWKNSKLVNNEGRIVLNVQNAKNTNGRAHGANRNLDITDFTQSQLDLIYIHLKNVKKASKSDISWNRFYQGSRKSMNKINHLAFPKRKKHLTLYTARHQFAANMKASGYSKCEVAALMGHATDETAGIHYGKKKHGIIGLRIKANPAEVDRIIVKSSKQDIRPPSKKNKL